MPIIFGANTGSPTAGYWGGIQIKGNDTGSTVAYAQISYATSGITLGSWSQVNTIHHVSSSNGSSYGIDAYIQSGPGPVTYQNEFVSNSSGGFRNQITSSPISSRYCWWNSASGPSGSGPGTGQSVSNGINYEPWLLSTTFSNSNYFNSYALRNRTFNPNIGINADLSFGTVSSQNWTVSIINSSSQTVRTYTGAGTTGSIAFDGKNGSGVLQPNGTYSYQIDSVSAASAKGLIILDTTKQLTISNLAVNNPFFSPNADCDPGYRDPYRHNQL